jgi:hypothetical protein
MEYVMYNQDIYKKTLDYFSTVIWIWHFLKIVSRYFATFNYSTEDLAMLLHIHIGVTGLQKAGYVIY